MDSEHSILTTSPSMSSSETNESIINRKREHRGLPSSFSSNLSRRISPPRPQARDATPRGNRSVKSIVAWLESSPNSPKPSQKTNAASIAKHVSPTAGVKHSKHQYSQPDVEEYSLTLLNYRKYFTEKPLGRCLDDATQNETVDLPVSEIPKGVKQDSSICSNPTSVHDASPASGSRPSVEGDLASMKQIEHEKLVIHEFSQTRRKSTEVKAF
ncbi:hypothetical protein S7711_11098 [Stachybotrys chartarum IBT 7711]|uniref:Uncharacterized protein n=1 Tax=Stachybotrys chartarum (strain CBS 109288 / IBT 7711) TaxID=1280523 RepID=A0A084AYB2_STACB|nr:hypothetical protein S7711_11098 [Stachybotrys chartarum IBT 7711]KFA47607.1 hypothetical protein S40293_11175 [Stachybotrys chartarum IBT 40293]